MPSSRLIRLVGIIVLFVAAGCCLVWYGTLQPAPSLGVPPDNDDVIDTYNRYVGEKIVVDGTVTSTDPLVIQVSMSDGRSTELTVDSAGVTVERGDNLAVYGRLHPDNSINAQNTVRKPGAAYLRTRIVSLIAVLWVLARALRHWQVDVRNLRVTQLNEPRWRLPFHKAGEKDDA